VPAALEDRRDLTPELVKLFVRNGVATMAPFRKTEVSDADLEALAAYLSPR
jgi:mono/diheme cytochrome c family protein